ncbi:hypothetical protein I550_3984 [Mycobacterium intracellulare 1956]|uniref:Uncharacterized protein n=1 Tax=Mycobacterium intracellulare 1956 TaxID=1299331 RepID=X8CHJ5_MYCIT|nr:hypothetical protein I550_3984 [Mycobacterium intracellulare 1956]
MNPQHHPRTRQLVSQPLLIQPTSENPTQIGVNLILISKNSHFNLISSEQLIARPCEPQLDYDIRRTDNTTPATPAARCPLGRTQAATRRFVNNRLANVAD